MRIRPATDADIDSVVMLAGQLFVEDSGTRDPHADTRWPEREGRPYYAEAALSDASRVFLAEDDAPRGYLLGRRHAANPLRPGLRVVELESMFVVPAARSAGVGRALVTAFTAWARADHADLLTVTAYAGNQRAREFYQRLGFADTKVTMEAAVT